MSDESSHDPMKIVISDDLDDDDKQTTIAATPTPTSTDTEQQQQENNSTMMKLSAKQQRSKGIEGWRYLMALWIYVFHYGSHWTSSTSNIYTAHVQTAVAAFMIMSGFVLGMAYEKRDWTYGKFWKQWTWFMGTRLARVYPLYFISWVATLYWTVTVQHWGQTWWGESVCGYDESTPGSITARVLTSLFLLQSWAPQTFFAVNGPAWFLSTLFWVWTIFPTTILYLKGRTTKFLLVAAIIAWIISLIPTIVLWSLQDLESDCMTLVYRDNPIFRAPEFVVGVCFGLLSNRRVEAGKLQPPKQYPMRLVKWGGDICVLAIVIPIFMLDEVVGVREDLFLPRLFVLPISVVLFYTVWNQGLAANIVSAPGLCDLGRYAWGIYILQEPLWYSLCSMVTGNGDLQCFAHDDKENGWAREANNVIAVFLLLNIVSGFCLKFEVPLYKWAKTGIETKLQLIPTPTTKQDSSSSDVEEIVCDNENSQQEDDTNKIVISNQV